MSKAPPPTPLRTPLQIPYINVLFTAISPFVFANPEIIEDLGRLVCALPCVIHEFTPEINICRERELATFVPTAGEHEPVTQEVEGDDQMCV